MKSISKPNPQFAVGDRVHKHTGAYEATGTIVAAFTTLAGDVRYVFEFDHPKAMLHIFNENQLEGIYR